MSEGGHPVAKVKSVARKAVAKKPVAKKGVAQVGSKCVVINGCHLPLPEGWKLEEALRQVMVEVPCTDLEQISIPLTALEVHLNLAPRVFAMDRSCNPLALVDVDGEILWRVSGAFFTVKYPSKDVATLRKGELTLPAV